MTSQLDKLMMSFIDSDTLALVTSKSTSSLTKQDYNLDMSQDEQDYSFDYQFDEDIEPHKPHISEVLSTIASTESKVYSTSPNCQLHSKSKPSDSKQPSKAIVINDVSIKKSFLFGSTREKRSFMSSKIEKQSSSLNLNVKSKLTKEELQQDISDDRNDKELMDLIQTTKLIENYASSELQGKERRTFLTQKMNKLTNASNPTCPQKQRYGLEVKRKERIENKLVAAKEIGLYSSTTKNLYTDKLQLKRKQKEKKSEGKELVGSIGKYRNGTLFIGKKDIENAQRGEKGNFGQVKRNFEVVNRPKSKVGSKNKNKKRR